MDIENITFIGLVAIGTTNVLTFFKPNLDSRIKFAVSVGAAFLATYVPAELGNDILLRLKDALAVALAGSGAYKLASKAGGQ